MTKDTYRLMGLAGPPECNPYTLTRSIFLKHRSFSLAGTLFKHRSFSLAVSPRHRWSGGERGWESPRHRWSGRAFGSPQGTDGQAGEGVGVPKAQMVRQGTPPLRGLDGEGMGTSRAEQRGASGDPETGVESLSVECPHLLLLLLLCCLALTCPICW